MVLTLKNNPTPHHLYVHIPFCKKICHYCDFVRFCSSDENIKKYISKIIKEINMCNNTYDTIYIGGGTPNSIDNKSFVNLISALSKKIKKNGEFTIEINPDLLTNFHGDIFNKYGVNRVSIGIQTTNTNILKKYNRNISLQQIKKCFSILENSNIKNISCDFIYGFNEQNLLDIDNDIKFIIRNKIIKHVSFYSLEVKDNSFLAKHNYQINDQKINDFYYLIINKLKQTKFKQYEVSNWCVGKKYQSKHNIAYWKTQDWKAIGLGAYGLENKNYYHFVGSVSNWKKQNEKLTNKDYYFQIISMGLRLTEGLDLSIEQNKKAYIFYKNKLINTKIKNNHLIAKNINLLNEILINLL